MPRPRTHPGRSPYVVRNQKPPQTGQPDHLIRDAVQGDVVIGKLIQMMTWFCYVRTVAP